MKRKFSLLINIATLALCVCAIAFGVYSAKTASLNVGGSVGFVAHNCEIELNGTIVACENSNATATKEVTIPQTFIGRGAVPSTYSLNLNKTFSGSESGKMYFSDLFDGGKIITITLKVKNQSKFDVVANVSRPTFENSACTMSVKLDDVELAEAGTSIELAKDGATEAVMVIKITLNNDANDISGTIISGTLFEFAKGNKGVGYNVNIQSEEFVFQHAPDGINTFIKFDSEPTSENDYDFSAGSSVNINFNNKTKLYVWGNPYYEIKVNNVSYYMGQGYDNAICVILTEDSVVIAYYFDIPIVPDPIDDPEQIII